MVSGVTDYLDGKIARAWGQTSRLGTLLDPAADRLYILATLIGLTVRDVVPLWLTLLLVGRDVLLACTLPVLRRHGYGPLPVHYLGKAATFNLLCRLPAAAARRVGRTRSATSRTPSAGLSRSGVRRSTGGQGSCTWSRCAICCATSRGHRRDRARPRRRWPR